MLEVFDIVHKWSNEQRPLFGPLRLQCGDGTITALVGPNGTGKTTLLNVISRRLQPVSGHTLVNETPAEGRHFNYMLQDPCRLLFQHLTMQQNLALAFPPPPSSGWKRICDILVGQEQFLHRYPFACSGGQQQRLVLCRTLADSATFPVTLLDEPLSQISIEVKHDLYQQLRFYVRGLSKVLIFVTHDIIEAAVLADTVVALAGGTVEIFDTSHVPDAVSFTEDERLRQSIDRALAANYRIHCEAGQRK